MSEESNDSPRPARLRSTGNFSDFTPVSHFVHGSARMFAMKHRERLRRIQAAHLKGSKPATISTEPPIGADEPVERYPDGEFAD